MKLNKSLKTNMLGSVGFAGSFIGAELRLFSGAQPATADAAQTGTLIAIAKPASGDMTFTALDGKVSSDGLWEFTTLATGTIGYARLCKTSDSGVSDEQSPRCDVAVAKSGSELNIPNNVVTIVGQLGHISRFEFELL